MKRNNKMREISFHFKRRREERRERKTRGEKERREWEKYKTKVKKKN